MSAVKFNPNDDSNEIAGQYQPMSGIAAVTAVEPSIPSTGSHESASQYQFLTGFASVNAWQPFSPVMRMNEMLTVLCISRSKAYELMKIDQTFPVGIPLYDSDNSPKVYWTHEVMAWLEARSNKFRNLQKDH